MDASSSSSREGTKDHEPTTTASALAAASSPRSLHLLYWFFRRHLLLCHGLHLHLLLLLLVPDNLPLSVPELVGILAHSTGVTARVRTACWTILSLQIKLRTELSSTTTSDKALKTEEVQQEKDAAVQAAASILNSTGSIQFFCSISIQPTGTPVSPAANATIGETAAESMIPRLRWSTHRRHGRFIYSLFFTFYFFLVLWEPVSSLCSVLVQCVF